MKARAIILHPKDCPSLEDLHESIDHALNTLLGGALQSLTTGKADFDKNFKQCGSWEAWAKEVSTGVDFVTREPKYTLFVVTQERVGAATARIVGQALTARKVVFLWRADDASFRRISRVVLAEERNPRTGWRVE